MDEILTILKRIEQKIDSQNFSTKEKGTIKKIDNLGRITIPISIRRNLDIDDGETEFKIIQFKDKIILEKMPN